MATFRTSRHPVIGAAAALALLLSACTSSTEISIGFEAPPEDAVEAVANGTTVGFEDSSEALPASTPAIARVVPAGWADLDAGSYRVAVPGNWSGFTDEVSIDAMFAESATPTALPAEAVEQYREVLKNGHAVVAVGQLGDNVNSFRQRGDADELGDPVALGALLEDQFQSFAQNVSVESQPRFFGEQAGIAITGRYDVGGVRHRMYQFSTAHDDHVYFFTVTLLTGPDQDLADQIFNSIEFSS